MQTILLDSKISFFIKSDLVSSVGQIMYATFLDTIFHKIYLRICNLGNPDILNINLV